MKFPIGRVHCHSIVLQLVSPRTVNRNKETGIQDLKSTKPTTPNRVSEWSSLWKLDYGIRSHDSLRIGNHIYTSKRRYFSEVGRFVIMKLP